MMTPYLRELKHALQMLSLPVTAQIRFDVGGRNRVRALAHTFQYWYRVVSAQPEDVLRSNQAAVLADLDKWLMRMCLGTDRPDWSDAALRRSAGWRQVRRTAREALAAFDWSLDLPPPDARIYKTIKGEITHGLPTLCRQTCNVPDQGQ